MALAGLTVFIVSVLVFMLVRLFPDDAFAVGLLLLAACLRGG